MNKTDLTETFRSRGIHRRNFIKTAGIGAAGAAMMGSWGFVIEHDNGPGTNKLHTLEVHRTTSRSSNCKC